MDNTRELLPRQVVWNEFAVPIWRHSLVILFGPSGSGKSTFAHRHFPHTMCVSTDDCRAMISDYAGNQQVSEDAFLLFYTLIEKRMANGHATVADSTALRQVYRDRLYKMARKYQFRIVLVFFDLPFDLCKKQDMKRECAVGDKVLEQQFKSLTKARGEIAHEKYDEIMVFQRQEEIAAFSCYWTQPLIERADKGPFDIVGDVHGCAEQLEKLFTRLGYRQDETKGYYFHPERRRAVFLGDIVDRGGSNLKTLDIVYRMWRSGNAYYVPGNHCNKVFRYLNGRNVNINEGMDKTVAELAAVSNQEREQWSSKFSLLYASAPPYLLLDRGRLLVCHAGILPRYIGRTDHKACECCLYGPAAIASVKPQDPLAWTSQYNAPHLLVYGHIPVAEPRWHNNTVDIDLGAGHDGSLAALRYPEKEIVQVKR
jgi:protein phosphatase